MRSDSLNHIIKPQSSVNYWHDGKSVTLFIIVLPFFPFFFLARAQSQPQHGLQVVAMVLCLGYDPSETEY